MTFVPARHESLANRLLCRQPERHSEGEQDAEERFAEAPAYDGEVVQNRLR
jgi:hypothetical protein